MSKNKKRYSSSKNKNKKQQHQQLDVPQVSSLLPTSASEATGKTGFEQRIEKLINATVLPPCHVGPIEIIPNLYLGSAREALKMPARGVTTLVPLYMLDASIWDIGFRGEIVYCPVEDYTVLPTDVLEWIVNVIITRLSENKKVGLCCMGGHGRTGYVAAVVLGKMGYADPIAFLREHYCEEAVETNRQVQHIAEVLKQPELAEKYVEVYYSAAAYGWGSKWSKRDDLPTIGAGESAWINGSRKSWSDYHSPYKAPINKAPAAEPLDDDGYDCGYGYDDGYDNGYDHGTQEGPFSADSGKESGSGIPEFCKDCRWRSPAGKCEIYDTYVWDYEDGCDDGMVKKAGVKFDY